MKQTAAQSTILFAGDDPAFADLVRRFQAQGFMPNTPATVTSPCRKLWS